MKEIRRQSFYFDVRGYPAYICGVCWKLLGPCSQLLWQNGSKWQGSWENALNNIAWWYMHHACLMPTLRPRFVETFVSDENETHVNKGLTKDLDGCGQHLSAANWIGQAIRQDTSCYISYRPLTPVAMFACKKQFLSSHGFRIQINFTCNMLLHGPASARRSRPWNAKLCASEKYLSHHQWKKLQ